MSASSNSNHLRLVIDQSCWWTLTCPISWYLAPLTQQHIYTCTHWVGSQGWIFSNSHARSLHWTRHWNYVLKLKPMHTHYIHCQDCTSAQSKHIWLNQSIFDTGKAYLNVLINYINIYFCFEKYAIFLQITISADNYFIS